jgi:RHS repeat-associated protein
VTYAPYGARLGSSGDDGPGDTGHVEDRVTGLVYAQQRYYDPMIGRFLSVDPVTANSATGANFNRYWYANNNPYKFTDPDGRQVCIRGMSMLDGCSNDPDPSSQEQPMPGSGCDHRVCLGEGGGTQPSENDQTEGDNELAEQQLENLADSFFEMLDANESPFGVFSKVFLAKDVADLSAAELQLTVRWGVKDLDIYRDTGGLHVINPQGSVIPWQVLRVDWSKYDKGPQWSSPQIFGHFLRRVQHEGKVEREP